MRLHKLSSMILATAVVAFAVVAQAETIAMVSVGNPNNAADNTGYGAVGHAYQIGTYEVTNSQYAEFLNAVAATDTYSLYNTNMDSQLRGGITRSGSSGHFTYTVKADMGDKPVNYVSWYDSLRFVNWLNNGQKSGLQTAATTESGAYTFTGATSVGSRNANAKYWLPSENEWYKAAYYDPNKTGGAGYYDYATKTDTAPAAVTANATGVGSAGNTGNDANFNKNAVWNSRVGNVTTIGTNGGPSAYGTFDQSGNVQEWTEMISGTDAGVRGGAYDTLTADIGLLSASGHATLLATAEDNITSGAHTGFRVAGVAVPEPGSLVLLAGFALTALFCWWRKRA